MKITPLPEEHVLTDGEGVELASGEIFNLRCCDCGLVHRVVIVSQDDKPVGLALERVTDLDDWKFKLFLKLRDFYRAYTQCGVFHVVWRPNLPENEKPTGWHVPFHKLTYREFLHRLDLGLLSRGGRTDSQGHPRQDDAGTPGRSGIWCEDASRQWTECGAALAMIDTLEVTAQMNRWLMSTCSIAICVVLALWVLAICAYGMDNATNSTISQNNPLHTPSLEGLKNDLWEVFQAFLIFKP